MGNKTSILSILYALFPLNYERYIEPFGGSGAVLLGKPVPDRFEVLNDYNRNLVNLYRCMQQTVGGLIEVVRNGDGTLIICNEEGKLLGMEGNRRIPGDVLAGPFFVVGDAGETFRSLTEEELERYRECFAEIEDISPQEVQAATGFFFCAM